MWTVSVASSKIRAESSLEGLLVCRILKLGYIPCLTYCIGAFEHVDLWASMSVHDLNEALLRKLMYPGVQRPIPKTTAVRRYTQYFRADTVY
jgi:hypothetical protein